MEIVVTEEARIMHYEYFTPSGLARELEVSSALVTKCIEDAHIPTDVARNMHTQKLERRLRPEQVLDVVNHLTTTHEGQYPDLEIKLRDQSATTLEVSPGDRPLNQKVRERGRTFSTRRITFTL